MKPVLEVISSHPATDSQPQSASRPTSPESGPALLERALVLDLWDLMGQMYGHRWTSNFGDQVDPQNVWAACLRGITRDQIRRGLNRCAVLCLEWPPSAPEFRKLCLGDSGFLHAGETVAHREYRPERLLVDQGAKSRARRAGETTLAQLKGLFGASTEVTHDQPQPAR